LFCDDEIFVAGMGDDILIGNGGMDVFNAGAGNDTITINASNITALAQTNAMPATNISSSLAPVRVLLFSSPK
jgi:Ca2+-binding RTX toxin-like protein